MNLRGWVDTAKVIIFVPDRDLICSFFIFLFQSQLTVQLSVGHWPRLHKRKILGWCLLVAAKTNFCQNIKWNFSLYLVILLRVLLIC